MQPPVAIKPSKMIVEQYDSPLRYTVTSESKPGVVYLVDLAPEEYPHPVCSCKDFQCRHLPNVTHGADWKKGHYCKHIDAVVIHLAWLLIDTMIEIERNKAQG